MEVIKKSSNWSSKVPS